MCTPDNQNWIPAGIEAICAMLENNYDIVADVTLQSYQEVTWNSRKCDVCIAGYPQVGLSEKGNSKY